MKQVNDTICAVSTPAGVGGIAVVRLSGSDAFLIADTLFKGRRQLSQMQPYTLAFGKVERAGEMLDEVVVSVFRAPHSYTGEDVVEISCHGSQYVQQTLLRWLIDAGARLAKAGEFTKRAFLAGKMNLMQAEAVADLIAAQSSAEHRLAVSQMRGGVETEIRKLREQLLEFTSLLELELDFADHEELEFADRTQLLSLVDKIQLKIVQLLKTFKHGNAIKNGISVAILGRTNVGKSTLLNALVGEERAIVSDINGTTRDTIEQEVTIGGVRFRFVDTAGIRDTADTIEKIGIERSFEAARKAHIVLLLSDAAGSTEVADFNPAEEQLVIHVVNKADLIGAQADAHAAKRSADAVYVSAKNSDIAELTERLERIAAEWSAPDVMIANVRHYEALKVASEALCRVREGLTQQFSGELVALDLHDCLAALAEITGEVTSDEVLASVFSRFCIGK